MHYDGSYDINYMCEKPDVGNKLSWIFRTS